ncbi:MAG: hypothetical protein KY463_16155 [Actinobacteria bacterium]|nr:hypothetical protein [Actinomycetota bacterium]
MLTRLFRRCAHLGRSLARALQQRLLTAAKPAEPGVALDALADLVRSRPALIAENAFLRQQLLILRRSVKRPRCTPTDRALLVLLASRLRAWRQALVIVQPETVLRWHRQSFRLFWRWKSRPRSSPRPKVAAETIALIREMAAANRLWGAERIRGELLKLGIRVAKWTVQQYMRGTRPPRRAGQTWATFLRNHAHEIWACDFLPITDVLFRPLYAFFLIALGSRRVVHVGERLLDQTVHDGALVLEVEVDRRTRDERPPRDRVDRDPLVRALAEQLAGSFEDRVLGRVAGSECSGGVRRRRAIGGLRSVQRSARESSPGARSRR